MIRFTKASAERSRANTQFRFNIPRQNSGNALRKRRSGSNGAIVGKLDKFINENDGDVIRLLYRNVGGLGDVFTYAELRDAIIYGDLSRDEYDKWRERYSEIVTSVLAPMWRTAIAAGAKEATAGLDFLYDPAGKATTEWIKSKTAEFVTAESAAVKGAIKEMVNYAYSGAYTVDELARVLRPCIGLTERQAKSNFKYYNNMRKNYAENHPRISAETAEKRSREAAAKYAAKQHRTRAETIARTEMAYAYNHGMDDAIKEMMSEGLMGRMRKVWRVAPGCCGICADLDGLEVDVGESFQFRGRTLFDGAKEVPPAHPNCRCVVMYEEAENSGLTFGADGGIIGLETKNGIKISEISEHSNGRAEEREVSDGDVIDALSDPLNIGDVVIDEYGRPSQRFIGANATVNINPDTGKVITVWKTGTRDRNRYSRE